MNQIRITHVGSMPRGEELTPLLRARDAGEPYGAEQFDGLVSAAVDPDVTRKKLRALRNGADIAGVSLARQDAVTALCEGEAAQAVM